jgi:arylsulfatase A-like enzyme
MRKIWLRLLLIESGISAGLFLSEALARRGFLAQSWPSILLLTSGASLIFLLSWPLGLTAAELLLGREKERAAPYAIPAYLLANLLLLYVITVRRAPTAAPVQFAAKTMGLTASALLVYLSSLLFARAYRHNSVLLHGLAVLAAIVLGQYLHSELLRNGYTLILPGLCSAFTIGPLHHGLLAKIAWIGALWISVALASLVGFLGHWRKWRLGWTLVLDFLLLTAFSAAVVFSSSRGKEDIARVLDSYPPADPLLFPMKISGPIVMKKVEIADESRDALFLPPPDSVTFELEVPWEGNLMLGFGLLENAWRRKGNGVSFEVSARKKSGERKTLTSLALDPASREEDRRWVDLAVSLDAFAGSRIEVSVAVRGGTDPRSDDTAFDYAVMSFPRFVPDPAESRKKGPPNIILLLIDTLRADRLGCYGSSNPTPHIDALARTGIFFERAVSTAPWTVPSVLSIHTSLYPSDLWNPMGYDEAIQQVVPQEVTTLAERLRDKGFSTTAVTDHPGISDETGYLQGFERIVKFFKMHSDRSPWGVTTEEDTRSLEEATARALGDLGTGPFLLYLHLIYPHYPYAPPDSYRHRTTSVKVHDPLPLDPEKRDLLSSLYDAEVLLTDDYVGFLMRELEEQRLVENTALVLISDHGEGFLEHGLLEHGNSLYQELLSVPFIIWAPALFPEPHRVTKKVSLIDLAPTLLDLAEERAAFELRGRSLLTAMQGEEADSQPLCYSEMQFSGDTGGRSVQNGETKLIWDSEKRNFAFYDLERDPLETAPRLEDPEKPRLTTGTPHDYPEALLRHIASGEAGVIIWCEGISRLSFEARSQGSFEAVRSFRSGVSISLSAEKNRVSVLADSLPGWDAFVLTLKDAEAATDITLHEIVPNREETGVYIGPDRIRQAEHSLTVIPGEAPSAWDLLSRPRPASAGVAGVWIWATRKSRTTEGTLSEETLDMLKAMGYIQ